MPLQKNYQWQDNLITDVILSLSILTGARCDYLLGYDFIVLLE